VFHRLVGLHAHRIEDLRGQERHATRRILSSAHFWQRHHPCRAAARKTDSAEVYIGEESIGLVSEDKEDGETSYDFHMAILDIDLED